MVDVYEHCLNTPTSSICSSLEESLLKMKNGNSSSETRIQQVQCGPLKLDIPTELTLRQQPVQDSRLVLCDAKFKGSLEISNKGNELIMSKNSSKLQVKPNHGFIKPNQSVSLKIYTKSKLTFETCATHFGLLILATTCKVTGSSSLIREVPALWKEIIHRGSSAFVDTFKIKQFHFVNIHGDPIDIGGETDANANDDNIEDYLSSTSYSSECCADLEQKVSDMMDGSAILRKRLNSDSFDEMLELTEDLEVKNDKLRGWTKFMLIMLVLVLLSAALSSFGRLEAEIILTHKRK